MNSWPKVTARENVLEILLYLATRPDSTMITIVGDIWGIDEAKRRGGWAKAVERILDAYVGLGLLTARELDIPIHGVPQLVRAYSLAPQLPRGFLREAERTGVQIIDALLSTHQVPCPVLLREGTSLVPQHQGGLTLVVGDPDDGCRMQWAGDDVLVFRGRDCMPVNVHDVLAVIHANDESRQELQPGDRVPAGQRTTPTDGLAALKERIDTSELELLRTVVGIRDVKRRVVAAHDAAQEAMALEREACIELLEVTLDHIRDDLPIVMECAEELLPAHENMDPLTLSVDGRLHRSSEISAVELFARGNPPHMLAIILKRITQIYERHDHGGHEHRATRSAAHTKTINAIANLVRLAQRRNA